MSEQSRIGVTGLATMGANLARNLASKGVPTVVHNRTQQRTDDLISRYGDAGEAPLTTSDSLESFVNAIATPRAIVVMVKAGQPVDALIGELTPLLDQGDLIIDGGNSRFTDTQRRAKELEDQGFRYLGTGISGGEEGALKGPSIMPGGTREAYDEIGDVLEKISAHVDGEPCCRYIGPDGAGHYVKMVHNGIEYADMQLIAESYDLLRHGAGLEVPKIAEVFRTWNEGELDSFLIEIAARVLEHEDAETGKALVDVIRDEAEQKGTGRWTAQDGLELGVPLTAITEAVFARGLSSQGDARRDAATRLAGPDPTRGAVDDPDRLVDDLGHALYAAKLVSYAQGFEQMAVASEQQGWDLDLGSLATIWRGGCIIRARFLDRIRETYDAGHSENLLLADFAQQATQRAQDPWRRVVGAAITQGVATPAFSSTLAYYDGFRRDRTPASLIQGLRDFFGAHTYERMDKEGSFHVMWGEDGREVEA